MTRDTWCVQDTNKQVKDTPFPSVTICTEGINMDAIIEVRESLIPRLIISLGRDSRLQHLAADGEGNVNQR